MMLNRLSPPTIGGLADSLGMDRTTITANLKPLERRGLLSVRRDKGDVRVKLVFLTAAGQSLLAKCFSVDRHLQFVIDKVGRVDISFNAVGIPDAKILGVPLVELAVEQFSHGMNPSPGQARHRDPYSEVRQPATRTKLAFTGHRRLFADSVSAISRSEDASVA
jgi:DNA-binding transcriptional ArsR family regulator